MGNGFYSCSVPMNPDMDKFDFIMEDEDVSASFEMPEIYYDGFSDPDDEEPMFEWSGDSVLVKRGNHIVKYTAISFYDVLLKKESGGTMWVNGKVANIEGVSADEVLNYRLANEYRVTEYDLEKSEKRHYKVVLEETTAMAESECRTFDEYFEKG